MMTLKLITRTAVALIIAAILGFALLQHLSISALNSLIEGTKSQTPNSNHTTWLQSSFNLKNERNSGV